MTINGGATWAAASQSYGKGSVQGQSGASGKADYTSIMEQAANTLMTALDSDKSGSVDKAEFSQAAQALAEKTGKTYNDADTAFSTIDNNSDGTISADELMKALQQSQDKQAHGGHHRHKPEALDTSSQSLSQTTDATQSISEETASLSKMQAVLLQRVMAAYSSNAAAANSSTTLANA